MAQNQESVLRQEAKAWDSTPEMRKVMITEEPSCAAGVLQRSLST